MLPFAPEVISVLVIETDQLVQSNIRLYPPLRVMKARVLRVPRYPDVQETQPLSYSDDSLLSGEIVDLFYNEVKKCLQIDQSLVHNVEAFHHVAQLNPRTTELCAKLNLWCLIEG